MKIRFNVKVPDTLHNWLKVHSAVSRKTASNIIEGLIEQSLSNPSKIPEAIQSLINKDVNMGVLEASNKGWSLEEELTQRLDDLSKKLGISKNYIISLLILNLKLEVEAQDER